MPIASICLDCNRLYVAPPETRTYGRCPTCYPAYSARKPRGKHRNTTKRKNANNFYSSTAWRTARTKARARDGCCTKCGTTDYLTVHHITPVNEAPHLALDLDNLQTLCRSCHGRASNNTRRVRERARGGTA
jgi:5-methylcytosine-specific restriction endonuclease McrA